MLALSILETLADAQGHLGVTQLADRLGTTKSRIHRHLRTLVAQGYITQSPLTERYRIGPRLISLGQTAARTADLTSVAQFPMRALRDETGHGTVIGRMEEDGIRILHTIPSLGSIDVGVRPGSKLGLLTSAQGKMAVAMLPEAAREEILSRPITGSTEFSITDTGEMRRHLAEIRARGWATASSESVLGLNALACPLLGPEGALLGTVAIVSLPHFIRTPPDPAQIAAVRRAAREISAAMGFDGIFPGEQAEVAPD